MLCSIGAGCGRLQSSPGSVPGQLQGSFQIRPFPALISSCGQLLNVKKLARTVQICQYLHICSIHNGILHILQVLFGARRHSFRGRWSSLPDLQSHPMFVLLASREALDRKTPCAKRNCRNHLGMFVLKVMFLFIRR